MDNRTIEQLIDNMTLDDKIGQMCMGNICGGESLELAQRLLAQYRFGALQFSGVFERFIRGGDYLPCGVDRNKPLEDTAAFLHAIKQASLEILGLPVILAGDQEGAISNSIFRRRTVAMMPNQMGLGAANDPALAYETARVSAREVKTLGLDMLYGPSLDVNTNPANPEIGSRAFSDDPEQVAILGEQVIKAYAAERIISNVKHFPGRGHGSRNAHHDLETIAVSKDRLQAVELLPFRRAIAAGVDSCMIAHTLYPAYESRRLPASLSPVLITDLLRTEMGFDGLVIPDDLSMFAISNHFGLAEASALCLVAGADMIFTKVIDVYPAIVETVKRYIAQGLLTEAMIHKKLTRILTLKHTHRLFELPAFSREQVTATVGCMAHTAIAQEAAARAVVMVKNTENQLPLAPGRYTRALVVTPRDMNVVLANDDVMDHDMLARALRRDIPTVHNIVIDEQPTIPQAYEAVGRAKNAHLIVFGVYSAGASAEMLALLQELVELGTPVIVVITNSPAAAVHVPDVTAAVICSFNLSPFGFAAVGDVLAGRIAPTASLPMTL